ncbi:hypothetical protein J31TS4_47050 [Paenibacillus sp. J31TS4]|uniref:S4 domain-containing protein n=1 Tax=Paenibacillus sp. J31TS4 TaxID=2807195 RepID=UPI001B0DC52E|nr:S4 domain-containing protein [Paenibacillus sp. J31TS4]GIP41425.1 hypothetical protein J31TS4_47050 [Paenibacillus sp. J31TS4]
MSTIEVTWSRIREEQIEERYCPSCGAMTGFADTGIRRHNANGKTIYRYAIYKCRREHTWNRKLAVYKAGSREAAVWAASAEGAKVPKAAEAAAAAIAAKAARQTDAWEAGTEAMEAAKADGAWERTVYAPAGGGEAEQRLDLARLLQEGVAVVRIRLEEIGEPCRLDRLLAERVSGASRSRIAVWIQEGRILLDGKRTEPSARLRRGQLLTWRLTDET